MFKTAAKVTKNNKTHKKKQKKVFQVFVIAIVFVIVIVIVFVIVFNLSSFILHLSPLTVTRPQKRSSGVIFSMRAGVKDGKVIMSEGDVMGPERRRRDMMSRAWT